MQAHGVRTKTRLGLVAFGLLSLPVLTGCQVDVSGQTLPSPYWLSDDVQYFPAGTEFKLSREAAAMEAAAGAEGPGGPIGPPAPGADVPAAVAPAAPVAPLNPAAPAIVP